MLSNITKTILGGLEERVKDRTYTADEAKLIWGGNKEATYAELTENQRLQLLVSAILDDLVKAVNHAQQLETTMHDLISQNQEMRKKLDSYGSRAQRRAK